MSDYVLTIMCDHTRNPLDPILTPRMVTQLIYKPRPPDREGHRRFGWIEWRELVHPDPTYPPSLQTYFGEGRPGGMSDGTRWRFWCRDCEDTLLALGSNLEPVLDRLRHADHDNVTLAGIAPRL